MRQLINYSIHYSVNELTGTKLTHRHVSNFTEKVWQRWRHGMFHKKGDRDRGKICVFFHSEKEKPRRRQKGRQRVDLRHEVGRDHHRDAVQTTGCLVPPGHGSKIRTQTLHHFGKHCDSTPGAKGSGETSLCSSSTWWKNKPCRSCSRRKRKGGINRRLKSMGLQRSNAPEDKLAVWSMIRLRKEKEAVNIMKSITRDANPAIREISSANPAIRMVNKQEPTLSGAIDTPACVSFY